MSKAMCRLPDRPLALDILLELPATAQVRLLAGESAQSSFWKATLCSRQGCRQRQAAPQPRPGAQLSSRWPPALRRGSCRRAFRRDRAPPPRKSRRRRLRRSIEARVSRRLLTVGPAFLCHRGSAGLVAPRVSSRPFTIIHEWQETKSSHL